MNLDLKKKKSTVDIDTILRIQKKNKLDAWTAAFSLFPQS